MLLRLVDQAQAPRPRSVRPILIVGAGRIVKAAHLPAYTKAGFPVIGLLDASLQKAERLASQFGIERIFTSISEATRYAPSDVVFDVAVPASQLMSILPELPDGSPVLMQKPMGETIAEARAIRNCCRSKRLTAAANFPLRYSPNNLAVAALAKHGLLGEIHDSEIQTRTHTP